MIQMKINIHPIQMGISKSYIIQQDGIVMMGDGISKKMNHFTRELDKLSLRPTEIQLIILSHGHHDHVGAAKELKELTGAKIVMHRNDKDMLEKGLKVMPPGVTSWGRILSRLFRITYVPFAQQPKTDVEIMLDDEGMSLTDYGIQGRILHTPGHTPGSISILLETGEAFVGCMAMNMVPLTRKPSLPIFAEDLPKLKQSWKSLLENDVRIIYPAHGKPFSADIARKNFSN
jgi:glyoxylase-like metal-dependent hydrolase (beta-lactamase superfamily II)